MKLTNAFFLICIFLYVTPITSSPDVRADMLNGKRVESYGVVEPEAYQQHRFPLGDSLFGIGDYYLSAIEYERAYYLSDNQQVRMAANLGKVRALKQMGAFEKARNDIQRSLPFADDPSIRLKVLYEWVFCAYMAGIYNESLQAAQQIAFYFGDQKSKEVAGLLHALSLMQLERWTGLKDYLEGWTDMYTVAARDASSIQEMQLLANTLIHELQENQRPRIKNPERARLYSTLIPGMGYVYAGAAGQGSVNMLSQALSLGTAALLAFNGYYISTFTIGLGLFQSFYFGGIKQSGNLTTARNEKVMNGYKQTIGSLLIDFDTAAKQLQAKSVSRNSERALEETLLALYHFDFKKADSVSSNIAMMYADQYVAHFSRANYLWWLIITQPFSTVSENQYRESVSRSMALAKNNAGEMTDNQDLFYSISLYAMQARLDLKNGAYIRAMRNGRNAISHIERSKGKEDAFPGFLLTSGLYNYMTVQAGRKYPFLKIYSIFYPDGDRALGLAQLHEAAQSDYLIWQTEANYFLMRLYLEMEQEPDKALQYADWLTRTFPSNLIFQYYHLLILKALADNQAVLNKKDDIRFAAEKNRGISKQQRDYFLELISE